jgi:hypothetical protein
MTTTTTFHERLRTWSRLTWLLPGVSLLTLWGTFRHQPDPSTRFDDWSAFVTTDLFLVQHVTVSIAGQSLFVLGAIGLAAVLLVHSPRGRSATWGLVLAVLGSGGLLAAFGLAAFGQPAVGDLQLQGHAAKDVYDAMYSPVAFVVILTGALLWALSTPLLAWSARGVPGVDRWTAWLFGASAPLVGLVGVLVGELQTVGSVSGVVGGVLLARRVQRLTLPEAERPSGQAARPQAPRQPAV